jgi:hypothetical protein
MDIPHPSTVTLKARQTTSAGFMATLRASLRVFLLFFPMTLLHLFLHEGGHALVNLFYRIPHTVIFIHPFSFAGYSRPIFDFNNVWLHMGGTLSSMLVSLVLFISFWKRRNATSLLVVILFPWFALWEGLAFLMVLGKNGDYYNLSLVTGLPAGLFVLVGLILFLGGAFLFISLFPRLGLAHGDKNTLWAIPAGIGLYGLVSLGVAHWLVPGSPFLLQYDLVQEVLDTSLLQSLAMTAVGLLTAGLYVTLYRAVCPKLPAGWRVETKALAWRDLRWPAIVTVVSVLIGLAFIF